MITRVHIQADSLDGQRLADIWVNPGDHLIGRRRDCAIVLDHPSVSRMHARLVVDDRGCRVVNESLSNGVRYRGRDVPREVSFTADATLLVGEVLVHIMPEFARTTWWLVGRPPLAEGMRIPFLPGQRTIGRSGDADIALPHPSVSRVHAHVLLHRDEAIVVDHGSSNGTRVNGEMVSQPVVLRAGDILDIGDLSFEVQGGQITQGETVPARADAWSGSWRRPGTRTLALISGILLVSALLLVLVQASLQR